MPELTEDTEGDRPRATRSVRGVAIGATFGAVVALAVSAVLTVGGRNAGGGEPPEPSQRAFEVPVGSCLDWTAPDGADARPVDCAQPHLFETIGTLGLGDGFGPAAAFPAENAWLSIVREKCTPLAATYLDNKHDPFGRFAVGALKPSQQGWRNGDRSLHCGLQVLARSGEVYRVQGGARGADQADIHALGTCLAIDGVDVGDPVDCAQPHAVEVVGIVDLAATFPADYPDEAKQDEAAGKACTTLAAEYAGGPDVVTKKKLTVYWDTLRLESWQAGTRKVDCKLGALLPDKSGFAPVTGGVRGEVAIATAPAPPLPKTAVPGAPAPIPPPTPPPPPPAAPAPTSTGG